MSESPSSPNDSAYSSLRRKLNKEAVTIQTWSTGIAMVAGIIAFVAGFWLVGSDRKITSLPFEDELRKQLEAMQYNVDELGDELAVVQAALNAISDSATDTEPNVQIAEIRTQVLSLNERLNQMDAAILESPTKALSLPLLRKDLESLSSIMTQSLNATRNEMDRIYDLNKWFIGLMITTAIGILGLAIGNLYQSRR